MKDNRQYVRCQIPGAWATCPLTDSPTGPTAFASAESRFQVADISVHGVGFTTSAEPPAPGTELRLTVGLPGARHTFEVRGTVAWTKERTETVASDMSSIWARSTIGRAMKRRSFVVGVELHECPPSLAAKLQRPSSAPVHQVARGTALALR